MWTVRLSGLPPKITAKALKDFMAGFGDVLHVNHSKCGSETLVVFSSRQAADAADQFLTEKGFGAIPGVSDILEARAKGEHNHTEGSPVVALAGSSQVCYVGMHHESTAPFCDGDDVGSGYMSNIETFVLKLEGVINDETLVILKNEINVLSKTEASQSQVAAFLLNVGKKLTELDDGVVKDSEAMDMWMTTIEMIASGKLSQHCDRFADTSVNELLACLDTSKGGLDDAWAETE